MIPAHIRHLARAYLEAPSDTDEELEVESAIEHALSEACGEAGLYVYNVVDLEAAAACRRPGGTSAHTPGPWRVNPNDPTSVIGPDGFEVADTAGVHLHVDHDGTTHWGSTPGSHREIAEEEEAANAALCAAAPDLLDIARGVLDVTGDAFPPSYTKLCELRDAARATVPRATGGAA